MPVDDAILVRVADAITALLNDHDFGIEFEAVRSYADWDTPLEDLAEGIRVDVVVVGHKEADDDSRGSIEYIGEFDIGIRKKFTQVERQNATGEIDEAEKDRMVKLGEQIYKHLLHPGNRRLEGTDLDAVFKSGKFRVSVSSSHLRQHQMFLGILRVEYTMSEECE